MGCDIHMYYEIRYGDAWKYFDWRSPYVIGTYTDGETKYDYIKMADDPLSSHRNYNLFAVLADVRNGSGFAGCYTGEEFRPICAPRGLPSDVSLPVKKASGEYGDDGHSHSWFTLTEVIDYDYQQERTGSGVVGPNEFAVFEKKGKPESWSGDVMGDTVVKITNEGMRRYLKDGFPRDGRHYYTRVSWRETYRAAIGDAWFKTLEELKLRFCKSRSTDDVRLVFWFDN